MNLFVLDTDILSLLQAEHAAVSARDPHARPGCGGYYCHCVDEQLRGWYTLVRKAKTPAQVAFAYDRLARTFRSCQNYKCHLVPGSGGVDLRIAEES